MGIQQGSSSRREHLLCITVARLESRLQDNPYKNPSKTMQKPTETEISLQNYNPQLQAKAIQLKPTDIAAMRDQEPQPREKADDDDDDADA
ncbi:hypothetical protein ACLOJK_001978, partial [Asimina triloba]